MICGYVALVRTAALTFVLALALSGPASAQDEPIFTVTAPTGVYRASQSEFDHWLNVARATGGSGSAVRAQVFELLTSFAWIDGEAAELGLTVTSQAVARESGSSAASRSRTAASGGGSCARPTRRPMTSCVACVWTCSATRSARR